MPTAPLPFDRSQIKPGDRLCIAVSGGADSVALLLALHAANTTKRDALGAGLSAVHVNHGLRADESDADQTFVADLCRSLEVPLHIHRVSVPDRVEQTRAVGSPETIEEAARTLRYQIFEALIAEGRASAVLTAHTLDDQAETVLMKLLRGAWTEGLVGIHPVVSVPGGKILRPLLQTSRAEIEAFLKSTGQSWREDSSNTDEAFTRNRLRHSILPLLRQENPSLDHTLSNLAELAREEEVRWQVELGRVLPQLLLPGKPVRGGGRAVSTAAEGPQSIALEIERLRPLDAALRRRVLRAAARSLGVRLSFDETARLLALCGFTAIPTVSSKPGAILQLAHGLKAERSARELRLTRLA